MHVKYEESIVTAKIRVFKTGWQLCLILSLKIVKMINIKVSKLKENQLNQEIGKKHKKIRQYEMG